MIEFTTYAGLFLVAFLAATLLPAQSEVGLAALIISDTHSTPLLILAATAGNTLGSVANWLLGRGVDRFHKRPWFPIRPDKLEYAVNWYHRYGRWSLLLSWMPVIGDPITLAAGVLREPLISFLALVLIAKLSRYLVVAAVSTQLM